ncbi:condensation domain-containing protein, partial [Mycobacteriaceae bacterium Msp059]|nr:condensation domain-containing protein [Mycobacteriaceae bacterium Msp059]
VQVDHQVAEVSVFADPEHAVVDEGIGPVSATPIMRWLRDVQGPVDQFNQTVVLQAPDGVTEDDVVVIVQELLDRHATLRMLAETDADGEWALSVPDKGSVDARDRVSIVEELSDEALIVALTQLDPAGGSVLRALWVPATSQLVLMIHHLAVDGMSWRI